MHVNVMKISRLRLLTESKHVKLMAVQTRIFEKLIIVKKINVKCIRTLLELTRYELASTFAF